MNYNHLTSNIPYSKNKRTSKFIEIGGLVHFFLESVSKSSISAESCVSFIPAILLILSDERCNKFRNFFAKEETYVENTHFQTIALSDALYLAFPLRQSNCTPAVFRGVGIRTSIFCPNNDGLNMDFSTAFTSIRVRPTSRTNGIIRKGSEISLVVRYLSEKTENVKNRRVS